MLLEHLGLIGSRQISALVQRNGKIVWRCLARFDSEPAFSTLLDLDSGKFIVVTAEDEADQQSYLENTNILGTTF